MITKSRAMTVALAVVAAAIVLPRLMKWAADPKNKDGFVGKIVNPA